MTWPPRDNFLGVSLGAGWAVYNASVGSSRTVSDGYLRLFALSGAGGWEGVIWDGVDDSSPWMLTAKLNPALGVGAIMGMGLINAGTDAMCLMVLSNNSGTPELYLQRWLSRTAHFTDDRGADHYLVPGYWRIDWDGTHYNFRWSFDGVTWSGGEYGDFYGQYGQAGHLGGGATGLVLLVNPLVADSRAAFDWIRVGPDVSDGAGVRLLEGGGL